MKSHFGALRGVLVMAALVTGLAGPVRAVPPGLTVEFDGKGAGKVTFAGARHTGKAMHCPVCHLEIFDLSRSSQITRADHRRKEFCFICHDGHKAFAARSNCERCHVEPAPNAGVPLAVPAAH